MSSGWKQPSNVIYFLVRLLIAVQLTAQVSFDTVACVVRNAVKAYTALSHLGHLEKDDTGV
jgi:hypothetical protein